MGCPPPPYIKEWRRGPAKRRRRAQGGSPTPTGSRTPSFPCPSRRGGRKGESRGRKGGRPPPCPIRTPRGRGLPWLPSSLSTKAHVGPLVPPGVPITPRHSDNYPVTAGTHPVSEYSHPIYRSLRLDHFETPRHVLDPIRDSELPSVHRNI